MLNKLTLFLLLAGLTAFYACKDKLVDNPIKNQPPTTKIFLDTVTTLQQSRIQLYWTGDSPNGTVLGFYFSWDGGTTWSFTAKNDSLFSLQIGAADKLYDFRVAAVDNSGNGKYDSDVHQLNNNKIDVHFGPEPFTDLNGNGKWDPGEPFVDIGLIDPNPARLSIPIKNTAPNVVWDILSFHPDTSFTAMTFGWDAVDIDGNSTIQNIDIALNDTNNFVALNGTVAYVTIRTSNFTNPNPLMDIYLNGDVNNIPKDSLGHIIQLPGLIYNSNNIFYVRAVDISNAKSPWISSATQANSKPGWFVKKPRSNFAIVNNYSAFGGTGTFYPDMMDSLKVYKNYALGYDLIDLVNENLPYRNYTFLETVKLFKGILWYTDNAPSLDLAGATVQKITAAGVKIFFSMLFPQEGIYILPVIQQFLPILSDTSSYLSQLAPGKIVKDTTFLLGYPTLKVTTSVKRLIGFNLNPSVYPTYYFPNKELGGYVGFENKSKNIFFIALPLNQMNGIPGSVVNLLYQVLFNDFNLTP
jgi:hypothetical protein